MKIIHFEANPEDRKLLLALVPSTPEIAAATMEFVEQPLDETTAPQAQNAEVITVFVSSIINPAIIDALPNLKLIITRSTGFDHIDAAYAESKGITVCNIPAYGSRTVAEYAFALMLGLSRKTFQANFQIKTGHSFDYAGFEGFTLQGKTLGIIGTGRIGLEVAKIAQGFDMKIVAFDLFPTPAKAQEYGFTYLTLPELLGASDVVTLHVPYTKDTQHLINLENIRQFKKGALLINTSRGEVVDTAAILLGIQEKILAGAGLDVLEGEHELKEEMQMLSQTQHQEIFKVLLEDHVLMNLPEVVITPHMAFFTAEAKQEIAQTTLNNIAAFLRQQPQNVVRP